MIWFLTRKVHNAFSPIPENANIQLLHFTVSAIGWLLLLTIGALQLLRDSSFSIIAGPKVDSVVFNLVFDDILYTKVGGDSVAITDKQLQKIDFICGNKRAPFISRHLQSNSH